MKRTLIVLLAVICTAPAFAVQPPSAEAQELFRMIRVIVSWYDGNMEYWHETHQELDGFVYSENRPVLINIAESLLSETSGVSESDQLHLPYRLILIRGVYLDIHDRIFSTDLRDPIYADLAYLYREVFELLYSMQQKSLLL